MAKLHSTSHYDRSSYLLLSESKSKNRKRILVRVLGVKQMLIPQYCYCGTGPRSAPHQVHPPCTGCTAQAPSKPYWAVCSLVACAEYDVQASTWATCTGAQSDLHLILVL